MSRVVPAGLIPPCAIGVVRHPVRPAQGVVQPPVTPEVMHISSLRDFMAEIAYLKPALFLPLQRDEDNPVFSTRTVF